MNPDKIITIKFTGELSYHVDWRIGVDRKAVLDDITEAIKSASENIFDVSLEEI